jgi:hypothetical protein
MTTDKYDLHTIDYSVQGWDSILATDMEKLDNVIQSRFLATLGETVGAKKAIYMHSTGKYNLAQADGIKQPAIGVTLESGVLDDVVRAQRTGLVTDATWTWTVGEKVYLHPTVAGSLTQTKPDQNIQTLGIATSATTIFLTHIVVRYDHPNHTGDVTSIADGVQTIAANAVTNAKAAQMATKTYKGRTTAATGNAEDIPVATVKADLVLVKADVGLGSVDNTSDANKPVSTAQQEALDLKAPLASPTFTGNVKRSVQSGITAFAGGGQASAVVITGDIAEISVCATAGDSVKLPAASAGLSIFITNHGAAATDVFPNTGHAINETTVDTAKSLAVDASMLCIAYNSTNWECLTLTR